MRTLLARTTTPWNTGGWPGFGWIRKNQGGVVVGFLICGLLACGDSTGPDEGDNEYDLVLQPESALLSGCFGWPEQEFSPANNTGGVGVSVSVGETATEFTLRDPGGTQYRLSDLLETRPVLLVFGGFT